MTHFILFLRKVSVFVLFIGLEAIAVSYFSNSSIYTNAKIMNASNIFFGGVYTYYTNINSYFSLKEENELLATRLAQAQNQLEQYRLLLPENDSLHIDTAHQYIYRNAAVIHNSISKQNNFLMINKGSNQGIEKDMAVLYNNAIVGYVLNTLKNSSICISMLNIDFKTSGMGMKEDYYGSITWDGTSYEYVTLTEIPKYASIQVGDTIQTTSLSARFPPNKLIGTIDSYELINGTYYEAKIRLAVPFGKIHHVDIVKYNNLEELITP